MSILPPPAPDAQQYPPFECCVAADPRQHDAECPVAPLDQIGGE